jgi:hypothetical protein
MQADLRAGKRTEIDFLCGLIVQLGRGALDNIPPSSINVASDATPLGRIPAAVDKALVDTPVNHAVWKLVKMQEQQTFAPMTVDAIVHAVYGTPEPPRVHAHTGWWTWCSMSVVGLACLLFWYRHRFTAK